MIKIYRSIEYEKNRADYAIRLSPNLVLFLGTRIIETANFGDEMDDYFYESI